MVELFRVGVHEKQNVTFWVDELLCLLHLSDPVGLDKLNTPQARLLDCLGESLLKYHEICFIPGNGVEISVHLASKLFYFPRVDIRVAEVVVYHYFHVETVAL